MGGGINSAAKEPGPWQPWSTIGRTRRDGPTEHMVQVRRADGTLAMGYAEYFDWSERRDFRGRTIVEWRTYDHLHTTTALPPHEPGPSAPPPAASKEETVDHPAHYTAGGIECIAAIRAALTPEEFRGFCKGNVLKYVWRERHKGGDESLLKADWYVKQLTGDKA